MPWVRGPLSSTLGLLSKPDCRLICPDPFAKVMQLRRQRSDFLEAAYCESRGDATSNSVIQDEPLQASGRLWVPIISLLDDNGVFIL